MTSIENNPNEPDVSKENPVSENWVWAGEHRPAIPRALVDQMTRSWQDVSPSTEVHPAAPFSAKRRDVLAAQFPGTTLVIPTGNPKVRANDTDYPFRPGSDFFYLTGCSEPDAALVITAKGEAVLYIPRRRDQSTHEFFTNAQYGELWVGARRGVVEAALYYDITTAPLEELPSFLASLEGAPVATLRGFDARIDGLISPSGDDERLATELSEQRLIKDSFEIDQLQLAIDYTVAGFTDVVRALPAAEGRGERVIEGVFNLRARVEGNGVGYSTIAASGSNATILHWVENDGIVRKGDLLLLDAGIECNNLYTADVTRTLPISGTFTPQQRMLYEIVLRAQEAAMQAVKPGVAFRHPHEVAMRVITEALVELGILQMSAEEALRPDRQLQRRYTLHGTSHWLGIDVHDCANARNDVWTGPLEAGQVLTVEPGLYFQKNDLTVPEEFRGIGIRIEDDVLVTEDGFRNLSAALPRDPDEIEAWMAKVWSTGTTNLGL